MSKFDKVAVLEQILSIFSCMGYKFLLFSCLILTNLVSDIFTLANDVFTLLFTHLILHLIILHCVLHVEGIALQRIFGWNTFPLLIIFISVLLCFIDHSLDLFSWKMTFVISVGYLVFFSSALVYSRYIQDSIWIDIKGDNDLRYTPLWTGGIPTNEKFARDAWLFLDM